MMKLRDEFRLTDLAGEKVLVIHSDDGADLTKVVSLNATGAWLWEQLAGKEFDRQQAAALLCDRYGVDPVTALEDVGKWLEVLAGCGAMRNA